MQRRLALALTLAGMLWAGAIVIAPMLVDAGRAPLATAVGYSAAAAVCHQRSDRSFHLSGIPWLVCARCAGLYFSAAAAAAIGWLGAPRTPRWPRALLAAAAVPTAATLAVEWTGLLQPGNTGRFIAALPLGAAAAWVCVRILRAEAHPASCDII
jgi:uncharacterized membrane protein